MEDWDRYSACDAEEADDEGTAGDLDWHPQCHPFAADYGAPYGSHLSAARAAPLARFVALSAQRAACAWNWGELLMNKGGEQIQDAIHSAVDWVDTHPPVEPWDCRYGWQHQWGPFED